MKRDRVPRAIREVGSVAGADDEWRRDGRERPRHEDARRTLHDRDRAAVDELGEDRLDR